MHRREGCDLRPWLTAFAIGNVVTVDSDRTGLAILGVDECWALLETQLVGRVGISSGALPVILPVEYCVDEHRIIFRVTPETILDASVREGTVVAFEADNVGQPEARWSVSVTGRTWTLNDPTVIAAAKQRLSSTYADGRFAYLAANRITGRRAA